MRAQAFVISASMVMALAACDRGANGAAAPGKTGGGNEAAVTTPSTDIGTMGASAGSGAMGASGSGQPGSGLNGGMGRSSGTGLTGSFPSTSASGSAAVPDGSRNSTTRSSVGNR